MSAPIINNINDIQPKVDSAEKLAAVNGLPVENFIFAPEFNMLVTAVKEALLLDLQAVLDNGGNAQHDINLMLSNIFVRQGGISAEASDTYYNRFTSDGIEFRLTEAISGFLTKNLLTSERQWELPDANGTLAVEDFVVNLFNQIVGGAPEGSNNLNSLLLRLQALEVLVGDGTSDANTVISNLVEIMDVMNNYPEGLNLIQALNERVKYSDIINNLNQVLTGKPLDAAQGKVLKDMIAEKWTAILATAVQAGIMKLYTVTGTNEDGSITQKAITELLAGKQNSNVTTDYSLITTVSGLSSIAICQVFVTNCGTHDIIFFTIQGVSNSSSFSFTVPNQNNSIKVSYSECRIQNSGSYSSSPGYAQISTNSNVVNLFSSLSGSGTWGTTGNKTAIGTIIQIR